MVHIVEQCVLSPVISPGFILILPAVGIRIKLHFTQKRINIRCITKCKTEQLFVECVIFDCFQMSVNNERFIIQLEPLVSIGCCFAQLGSGVGIVFHKLIYSRIAGTVF